MIPVAGSAYTYAYATLGRARRLDHRLGPDPRVRPERRDGGGRLVGILRELPARSRPGAAAASDRGARRHGGPRRRADRAGRLQPARRGDRAARDRTPRGRDSPERQHQHGPRGAEDRGAHRLRGAGRGVRAAGAPGAVRTAQHRRVRPLRLERRAPRGGGDVLRVRRLRRGLDRRAGSEEPAARHADRHPRLARRLHRPLHRGGGRAARHRPVPAPQRGRSDRRRHRRHRPHLVQPGDQDQRAVRAVQHDAGPAPRPDPDLLLDEPGRAPARSLRPGPPAVPHAVAEHDDHRGGGVRRRRAAADRRARPAREHRLAVRVPAGLRGRAHPPSHRAPGPPPVPGARRALGAGAGRAHLPGADAEPAAFHLGAPGDLDGAGIRDLFSLQPAASQGAEGRAGGARGGRRHRSAGE